MRTAWSDFDTGLTLMDEFRRRVERAMDELDVTRTRMAGGTGSAGGWPLTSYTDQGSALVVTAEVPGLGEKDIALTLEQDVLTLRGERKADVPPGYSVHRQERPSVRFARSYTLPCKVDAEKVTAVVKDGVLTVNLPKAAESQPRKISVKAG